MTFNFSRWGRSRILSTVLCATGFAASATFAGARIDLRPDPPVPPGGYEPNTAVQVDVYFVDTGPSESNIQFRALYLDFNDSPPWDGSAETLDCGGYFNWNYPFGIPPIVIPPLPNTSWVYALGTPNPLLQITMPAGGEVLVGDLYVNVGSSGGTLDVMNADNPDLNFGARAEYGFNGPGDPFTRWRAYTGELTGGVLELPVVPEPATVFLFGIGLTVTVWARRTRK